MLKEGPEQVWALVFGQQRVRCFLGQVVNIPGFKLANSPYLVCASATLRCGHLCLSIHE